MTRDEIERVRADNRVEHILARYLELKPSGRSLLARCPFHQDRTPSLAVFPLTQTWWCFGCGTGGDIFEFVRRVEAITFKEAVERVLGPISQVDRKKTLPQTFNLQRSTFNLTSDHFTLLTAAAEVYHAALFTQPKLLSYLARRGFDAEAIRRFRIGYASGTDLARYFRYRGWDIEIASDLGLVGPYA